MRMDFLVHRDGADYGGAGLIKLVYNPQQFLWFY
jgi:hypothetical protein